jgi:hypothetical protein
VTISIVPTFYESIIIAINRVVKPSYLLLLWLFLMNGLVMIRNNVIKTTIAATIKVTLIKYITIADRLTNIDFVEPVYHS